MTRPNTPFTGHGRLGSLLRRVLLAAECDDRSEMRALVYAGPAASCAALGAVVAHIIQTLAHDRRLVTTWLEPSSTVKL
jgi:hypothetical protein